MLKVLPVLLLAGFMYILLTPAELELKLNVQLVNWLLNAVLPPEPVNEGET